MDSFSLLTSLQNKLPKDDPLALSDLKAKLDSLDEQQLNDTYTKIELSHLKSPAIVFWVGSFLLGSFGVGRFMIGDTILGIARLAITLLCFIFLGAGAEGVASLFSLVSWVWWIVDLFLVGKKLRRQNLQKVLCVLP